MRLGAVVLAVALAACGFGGSTATDGTDTGDVTGDAGDTDGSDDVPPGPCEDVGTTCASDVVLRECTAEGALPVDTTCAWGCVSAPTPHCGKLVPTADGVSTDDVSGDVFETLGDLVILDGAVVIGSDNPTIDSEPPGVYDALLRGERDHVRVFRAKSFTFVGNTTLRGDRSIQFVADGPIIVRGVISAVGPCGLDDSANIAGPGGFWGGQGNEDSFGLPGEGPGGGGAGNPRTAGGGGGGNGGAGGSGGNIATPSGNGGVASPAAIVELVGGSGGGGGGGGGGYGRGGGGGGAVHLISNTEIRFELAGGINAGGCGGDGDSGNGEDGGGGGGAGGLIVLEAPRVTGMGDLAVNGGGGGSGGNAGGNGKGENGQLSRLPAAGQPGNTSTDGGNGGNGGVALMLDGESALDVGGDAGGGGGAIGRIRFSTRTSEVLLGGMHSPALADSPTTATAGRASVE